MTQSISVEIYDQLKTAFDFFNAELFGGSLPECILTVQREKQTMGYFSPFRWSNTNGKIAHELALNPAYFAGHPLLEVFQTLVHEQCHLWQQEFGKPSRTCYHNREWAAKMVSIGLIPTDTGLPGGKQTGQKISDYADPGGVFETACIKLVQQGFFISWIDRRVAETPSTQASCSPSVDVVIQNLHNGEASSSLEPQVIMEILNTKVSSTIKGFETVQANFSPTRMKYSCENCLINVWGKPNLKLICADCNKLLQACG